MTGRPAPTEDEVKRAIDELVSVIGNYILISDTTRKDAIQQIRVLTEVIRMQYNARINRIRRSQK